MYRVVDFLVLTRSGKKTSLQEGLRAAARQEYINLVHEYSKLLPAAVRSVKVTDGRDLEAEEREQYERKRDKAYLDFRLPSDPGPRQCSRGFQFSLKHYHAC